jgi:hypothetical protein
MEIHSDDSEPAKKTKSRTSATKRGSRKAAIALVSQRPLEEWYFTDKFQSDASDDSEEDDDIPMPPPRATSSRAAVPKRVTAKPSARAPLKKTTVVAKVPGTRQSQLSFSQAGRGRGVPTLVVSDSD